MELYVVVVTGDGVTSTVVELPGAYEKLKPYWEDMCNCTAALILADDEEDAVERMMNEFGIELW